MPGRYIREGWNDSDRIRRAGEPAEILLLRLILVADDYARFDGRSSVIRNKCWPVEDEEVPGSPLRPTLAEIEKRLAKLESESLIFRYTVGGKPYLYIPNFQQRTRAVKSKYPAPDENVGHMSDKGPTDDGHTSGRWRTPDGQVPDTRQTHVGDPQAVSISDSGFINNNHCLKKPQENPEPVDKSAKPPKPTPPTPPQPPVVKPASGPLKPPAAMTPEEREAVGIGTPPAWLKDAAKKPPAAQTVELARKARHRYEPEPRNPDDPSDDELLEQARQHTATPALSTPPPADWENTPEGIDRAGATLGMKRLPFEEDHDYAKRIQDRIALG